MIKKNDCVPKKVLNERKLRLQAVAVMVGGLVVAFLLGLVIGWFIPKNDKKNVTASAEGYSLGTSLDVFEKFQGVYYASASSYVVRTTEKAFAISFCVSVSSEAVGEKYLVAINELPGYTSGCFVYNVATQEQASFGNIPAEVSDLHFALNSTRSMPITTAQKVRQSMTITPSTSSISFSAAVQAVEHAVSFIFSLSNPYPVSFLAIQTFYVSMSYNFDNGSQPLFYTDLQPFNIVYQGLTYTSSQYLDYGLSQKNIGYNQGYAAGLNAGNNNNFMSLITAIVDAPITAFTSLLDFDVLGYNMKDLALALLTAGLLIAAIRFFSRL